MLKLGNDWAQLSESDQLLIDPAVQPPSTSAVWQVPAPVQTLINDSGRRTSTNFINRGTLRLGSQKNNSQLALMEEIDVVDIQLIVKILDLGCYNKGLPYVEILLIEDPISRRAGMISRYAMGSLWPAIGGSVVPVDDPGDKRAFIERAVNELCSGKAPVGLRKYFPSQGTSQNNDRYILIGRKPG
jgi:hypothetical protein